MSNFKGIPVSPGVAVGTAVLVKALDVKGPARSIDVSQVDSEVHRYWTAVRTASAELKTLEEELTSKIGAEEAAIFEAQRLILEDPGLTGSVERRIREDLACAERAVVASCEEQALVLEAIDDAYLAARAADLRDIGKRLHGILSGASGRAVPRDLPDNSVIVADDLAPSDTASLDHNKIAAMVLDRGGRTSHTAILARSLGIPAVVGTENATSLVKEGDVVAVDGERGQVTINPNEAEIGQLEEKARLFQEGKVRLAQLKGLSAVTLDGVKIHVAANIGNLEDAKAAIECGAEGVGLFRTEFLFLDRRSAPTEEEQFSTYSKVLAQFDPRPVVVRTLDIGGDKDVPYLGLEKEENPFLGLRAIRLCLDKRDMFRNQLRALLRASVHGNLCIMFPMISNVGELREAKKELRLARSELEQTGVNVADNVKVGIMVEIPSAAIDSDILARECDFFSIGTNDLVQYTVACDRGNPRVAYLSDPFSPAVLRLIKRTIDEGHKRGIWVGMCGEMAGMSLAVPLLMGMGLDELSMSAGAVPYVKEQVRGARFSDLSRLWDSVKGLSTATETRAFLEESSGIDAR